MSIAELSSPPVVAVMGSESPVLAQANTSAAANVPVYNAPAAVAPSAPVGLGSLSGATPGTQIIRGDVRVPVNGDTALMVGDRVVVPQGGSANVTFPGPAGKTPLNGVLSGGSDATIGVKQLASGAEQVQVDMAAGDLFVAMPEEAGDASVAVRKKGAAGGSMLDNFALGALGLAGLAGLAGGGSDGPGLATLVPPNPNGPTNPTTPTEPVTPAPVATQGLLAPAAATVNNATNALGGGILQGSGLDTLAAPVDGIVATATDGLNSALGPLVGESFTPNNPNNFDPIDNAVGSVTTPLTGAISPVIDSLLGSGTTGSLVSPITTQVDFVTDAVSGLANTAGLGSLANGLFAGEAALAPVTGLVSGLVGDLLGTTNTLGAPLNDLLGDLTGAGGLNLGGVVGDVLAPVTGLLGGLTGNLNGSEVGGSLTTGGLGGLLDPVLGSDSPLAPVTDILNDLTGGLTGGLLGDGTTVAGGGDLGDMSSGLLGQITGPVEGLLGDLPILSLADTGANLGTGTDLLSSLLNTLNGSASTGVLDLSTSNLPVSADGLLGTLNGADPTGGLLGQVTGLLAPVTSAAGVPDAGLTADAGGLLSTVTGLQDTVTTVTQDIPAISSVTDLGHNSPLGGLLNNL
ncbi:MAG: hypothetical protein V4738_01035 [Pseudomonadota bacterium]